ncbi:nbs-lrr resistance protein [Corchorus olitorius]|uniref:Nbs-lrr resistance protein n=1 Tax=Corchorus olitorius TaxID=93759 RepID=A0A1R3KSH8_9ROSI|nr:nbs-lrr resistance protein [Corchorus olitorius]
MTKTLATSEYPFFFTHQRRLHHTSWKTQPPLEPQLAATSEHHLATVWAEKLREASPQSAIPESDLRFLQNNLQSSKIFLGRTTLCSSDPDDPTARLT